MRKILVYHDLNSDTYNQDRRWLILAGLCLSKTDSDVYVLLESRDQEIISQAVLKEAGVTVLFKSLDNDTSGTDDSTNCAVRRITALDRRYHFDMILSRGYDVASHLAESDYFTGRLWPYLTEGPAFQFTMTEQEKYLLTRIGDESRRIFTQTEEARSIFEANVPTAAGKVLLLPPIIPDNALKIGRGSVFAETSSNNISIVLATSLLSSGDLSELIQVVEHLQKRSVTSQLHIVGEQCKDQHGKHWLIDGLRKAEHLKSVKVTWHGLLSYDDELELVAHSDLRFISRASESSTSIALPLEMFLSAAVGTPPIISRSLMYERLLGTDYPLFVDNVVKPLVNPMAIPDLVSQARSTAYEMAKKFSKSWTTERVSAYFERTDPRSMVSIASTSKTRPVRVLVTGHDFKFAGDLIDMITHRQDVEFQVDRWSSLTSHDEGASRNLAEWADIIICEWAGPNAVFYSELRKPSQKLLVRFHGFELRGDWLKNIRVENVDVFVFVSDFYRREALLKTGWPANKTTVISNSVDSHDLLRQKNPDAQFQIGLVGYVPMLKRPDRAVELLRNLLKEDQRYYLRLRGRAPWNYSWEWDKPLQRDAYKAFYSSIASDPLLRKHIIFEDFRPDMGNWFRKVGWVLSPSTRETFHLAPVEGMASGAIPVVWERQGAEEIFGKTFVHQNTAAATQFILTNAAEPYYSAMRKIALDKVSGYEISQVRRLWMDLLTSRNYQSTPGIGLQIDNKPVTGQSEALGLFYQELERSGFENAYHLIGESLEHLEPILRTQLLRGRKVASWVRFPESILPSKNLAPLYHPEFGTTLIGGEPAQEFKQYRIIKGPKPLITGDFYTETLRTADSFTRLARRDRPFVISASGPLSYCFGALISARRLGIPFVQGSVDMPDENTILTPTYRKLSKVLRQEAIPHLSRLEEIPQETRHGTPLAKIVVGLIADEFTARTIAPEVETVLLDRYKWQNQLDHLDAVIVESAWEGSDEQWFHGVAYYGENEAQDLWELLQECKARDIPTIFWNKEDPVHFRAFIEAAKRCDHIFTTDARLISQYISASDRDVKTVNSLSFFAQPRIHNPLVKDDKWKGTISFAGTYYGDRFRERSDELYKILKIASDKGLTIYDRQHGRPDSPYSLPSEFEPYSVGSLSYDDVINSYRTHPIHINVNSVADSPSMFSRRVVEIAASGSMVVSGRGRGVRETLGPSFPVLETEQEWHRTLNGMLANEDSRLRSVLEQFRTVMRSHRADQALALALRVAGLHVNPIRLPSVVWDAQSEDVLLWAMEQSMPPFVKTTDSDVEKSALQMGLRVISEVELLKNPHYFVGAPHSNPHSTLCEDLLLLTLIVDADYLSVYVSNNVEDPLLQRGFGLHGVAIWSSDLVDPSAARNPYMLKIPARERP